MAVPRDDDERAEARRKAPSLWWAIVLLVALIVAGVLWASDRRDGEPAAAPAALSSP